MMAASGKAYECINILLNVSIFYPSLTTTMVVAVA